MKGARLGELDETEQPPTPDPMMTPMWCLGRNLEQDEVRVVSEILD